MSTATLLIMPILTVVILVTIVPLTHLLASWLASRNSELTVSESQVRLALLNKKERLLLAIQDLEFEYGLGKIEQTEFEKLQRRIQREALQVIQELEEL
jgi:hypothetical protein